MNKENPQEKRMNGWYILFDSCHCSELYKDINKNFIQRSYMGTIQKMTSEIRDLILSS